MSRRVFQKADLTVGAAYGLVRVDQHRTDRDFVVLKGFFGLLDGLAHKKIIEFFLARKHADNLP
jgi:hypothetical protein